MAVFEVSRDYLEKFVDEEIKKKVELREFKEELIDVLAANSPEYSEFAFGNYDCEDSWPYEKKEPSQLYLKDSRYHIRIKDVVVDFFQDVFVGALLEAMLYWYGLYSEPNVSTVAITSQFILFVKRVIKEYIIKLDNTEFCIYLQVVTHLKEHSDFSVDDLKSWLPNCTGDTCNMHTDKWICPDMRQGRCYVDKDKLETILQRMVSKNILEYSENGAYKIRY